MKRDLLKYSLGLLLWIAAPAHAGGPLTVCNGVPVKYPGAGTITLNYDQGNLGTRSKAQADALLTEAASLWTNVTTATVTLARGSDLPVDVTTANYSTYIGSGSYSDGLNPVIYDSDGSIIDMLFGTGAKDHYLGFGGSWNPTSCEYAEGYAIINGHSPTDDIFLKQALAHEAGHLIGLDHTQLDNTQGLSTNYPLMYAGAINRDTLSLHEDDIAAVSALYPDTSLNSVYGQLSGTFTLADGTTPIRGANLWVEEISSHQVFSIVSDYLMQNTGYFNLLLPAGNYTLHAEAVRFGVTGGLSRVGPYATSSSDYSFQAPLYVGGVAMAPLTLGIGSPLIAIKAGCSATVGFKLDGSGSVSGNCGTAAMPACTLTATPATIAAGGSSTLTASCSPAATSYVWTGGSCAGTSAASCTVTPAATTTYTVKGSNSSGSGNTASATVTIWVPASERQVLLDLYSSTNGAGWAIKTNWNGAPGTECTWYGVTCDAAQSHVTAFAVYANNLVGTLPSLSGLTALQLFQVQGNKLTGSIPSLSGLMSLQAFVVMDNQLTGSIPSLSGLTNLYSFQAGNNQLTGSIPSLSGLTALSYFSVNSNQLTGPVPAAPSSLWNSNLCGNSLVTSGNSAIDAAWVAAQKTDVTQGGVAAGNWLACQTGAPTGTGTGIPATERQVLLNLYASTNGAGWTNKTNWNGAAGTECTWYGVSCDGTQSHVTSIDLQSNNLVGTLPTLSGLTALQDFWVGGNQLSGSIPSLSGLSALTYFFAYNNKLTGTIPSLSGLTALQYFWVQGNQLTGSIPSLNGLTALQKIWVTGNQLSGPVPAAPTSLLAAGSNLCRNSLVTSGNSAIDAAWVAAQETDVAYGGVAAGNWLACQTVASLPPTLLTGLTGLWWNQNESGWGLNITQQDSMVHMGWYTYDTTGKQTWFVMPSCPVVGSGCTGDIYKVVGGKTPTEAWAALDFTQALSTAGSGTLTFSDSNTGTFNYTLNGVSGSKSIVRQVFATGSSQPAIDYSAPWGNSNESGWWVSLTQQNEMIFALLYTYDTSGNPVWYVASSCPIFGNGCSGDLYQVTGGTAPTSIWNPNLAVTSVGTVSFFFSDNSAGAMSYTINGVTGSKAISRIFGSATSVSSVTPVCTLSASPASVSAGGSSTLTASCTPAATSYSWSGGICSSTSATCAVTPTVTNTYTVTGNNAAGAGNGVSAAVTVVPLPVLNIAKSGTGTGTVTSNPSGITCGSDCSESYAAGTTVTLAATPATGSYFAGWSGDCSGIGSCVVTMDAARNVTATFKTEPFVATTTSIITATSATVSTQIAFNPSDVGKEGAVYITGWVPVSGLGALGIATASLSPGLLVTTTRDNPYLGGKVSSRQVELRTLLATSEPNDFVLVQLTPTGWELVTDGQLIPYASGVLGDQLAAQNILNNTDTTSLQGAEFYVGYGTSTEGVTSAEEMVEAERIHLVATIPCDTGSSCMAESESPVLFPATDQTIDTFVFSSATLAVGDAATVSATATSGLAVSFTSATPGICTVSGSTVTGVAAGTCTLAADQAGDGSYNAAPQVTQSVTVIQAGASCSTSISPASSYVSSSSGTGDITVTASSTCAWTATSNASWLTVTSGSSGNGNGSVVYAVAANTDTAARTGTLTIGGQAFTVTQAGATPTFTGARSEYQITQSGDSYTVTDLVAGRDGTRTVTSADHLTFSDMTVNLTVQAKAASIAAADLQRLQELYVAFFNRVPAADGLAYWIDQFNTGSTISQIADSFYAAGVANSSLTGFSSTMSNGDFVHVVYRNVLGRPEGAGASGLAYWSGELDSMRETRGSLVASILNSAHSFKGDDTYGWVADLLDNKIAVANQFSVTLGLTYNTPQASISNGMAIAAAVTSSSTAAALALIGVVQ
ncbi:MAG: DUF4214 domain-containing protein [Gallionella sp.]|nr:DUF4214 domain-containing protein [Gallionella sp.]